MTLLLVKHRLFIAKKFRGKSERKLAQSRLIVFYL